MPVNPSQLRGQAASIAATQKFIEQLQGSLKPASEGGTVITGAEAQNLIKQVEALPAKDLKDLKTAALDALTAKDHWECTPDARAVFADFLGVPAEKLPAPVDMRPEMGAMFTKARNEAPATRIDRKEFKQVMNGVQQDLPPELREMVTASVLGMQSEGQIKLDHDSRRVLTRNVAQTFGAEGPDKAMTLRDETDLKVSWAEGYLSSVIASGGSFEEILFALLLLLAEKADKKATDAMEEMANLEENEGGARQQADAGVRPGPTVQPGPPAPRPEQPGVGPTPDPVSPFKQGDVKQLAGNLEAMVQSAHHATTEKSEGGTKITVREAGKLTDYLRKMPKDVQKLLAGSVESALQVGAVPITGNAHFALNEWATEVMGREFDLSSYSPDKPPACNSALAKRLRESDKLEDRVASFLVETLYQPDVSLKEKMSPFKSLKAEMTDMAEQSAAAAAGAPGATAEQMAASPEQKNAGPEQMAAAAQAAAEPAGEEKGGLERVLKARPELAATVEANPELGKAIEEMPELAQAIETSPELTQQIVNNPDLRPGAVPMDDGSIPSNMNFDSGIRQKPDPLADTAPKGKSKTRAQHQLQMAINERQRVFDLLSNIMKAMHDTMMTSIRNIR